MNKNFYFNENISDFYNFTNLMLIDNDVAKNDIFLNSSNLSTFPLIYYKISNFKEKKELFNKINLPSDLPYLPESDLPNDLIKKSIEETITQKDELFNFIKKNNFTNLKRLCIVANDSFIDRNKSFLDCEPYFYVSDFVTSNEIKSDYSSNLKYLINLIKEFKLEHVDFLMCNALQNENWVKYFEILKKETGITIGASNDKTGNIKYGGDWLLESTNEDIKNIYFTNKIEDYTQTLVSAIIAVNSDTIINLSQNGSDIQYEINGILTTITFPCAIINLTPNNGDITVKQNENLTLEGVNTYFIFSSNNIIFDGSFNTITIDNTTNYQGLINNGDLNNNGYSNTTIKNINLVTTGNSTLYNNEGWIVQSYYSRGVSNNLITNCSSSGQITGIGSGGVVGALSGAYGSCSITNCSSSGQITDIYSGGIAGYVAGYFGSCTITNCSSSGQISGEGSGGIAGYGAGYSGSCSITNCSSSGQISGNYSGGIVSYLAGTYGSCTITNCCSSGQISGNYSGGIAGSSFGVDTIDSTISFCYSLGDIFGLQSGGIVGNYVGYSTTQTSPNVEISSCYSRGNINDNTAGGICGGSDNNSYNTNVSISNCYCLNGNIKSPNLSIDIAITNCYEPFGIWSDISANSYLDNNTTPTYVNDILVNPIGTVWADISNNNNVPYIFSLFGNSPYLYSSQSVLSGQPTNPAIYTSGYTYSIIGISNKLPSLYPNITIDSSNGIITAISQNNYYQIYVYALNNLTNIYSTSIFNLNVIENTINKTPITNFNLGIFYNNASKKITQKRIRKYTNNL